MNTLALALAAGLLAAVTLFAAAFYQREHNVRTAFKDGKRSIVIGTGLIGAIFVLWACGWALFIPQALTPFDSVVALALVQGGAGAGSWIAWHIMDSRDAQRLAEQAEAEAPYA